jgi:glyoxylase-like metal-dependent hydrolase (beta-lactamase superfamily II)
MDLHRFLDDYTNDVYLARDPEAARRFIADPCLRHEHGELVVMGIEENISRVQAFLDQFPSIDFAVRGRRHGPRGVVFRPADGRQLGVGCRGVQDRRRQDRGNVEHQAGARSMGMSEALVFPDDQPLGSHVTVISGIDGGKYPHGNSVLVSGTLGTLLIDPSMTVRARGGVDSSVDRILVSHAHEDHVAGLGLFPHARVHAHEGDLLGIQSLDGIMQVYGMGPEIDGSWRKELVETYHFVARPDATGFRDGEQFELGGVTVTAVHLAGHTRGHCGFLVEPDGVFFVGDIDLTGFGPYYGDHWSSLTEFEESLVKVRQFDAAHYVTFHQKGVVHGREQFIEMLDKFAAVIGTREARMLEFLREPHTIAEMVRHRFVYRPGVELLFADHVERRTATMHVERLLPTGAVVEVEPGLFRAA